MTWERQGYTIPSLGSPACIRPQKQFVSQGGLVGYIKCDYEGALKEEERRNGDREGPRETREGNESG